MYLKQLWKQQLKKILPLIYCGMALTATSQDLYGTQSPRASVERSVYGIQTGLLGIWGHNELKLFNQIALRSELGFDTGISGGRSRQTTFILAPVVTLEPRWYYNLGKRQIKLKRIDGNSGDFFSLRTSYHPDKLLISNKDYISITSNILLVPSWGMRRHWGSFTYEVGVGIAFVYYYTDMLGFLRDLDEGLLLDLHLRFGYRFNSKKPVKVK